MNREAKLHLLLLKREQAIRRARESFYEFCKLLYPDFYRSTRPHLKVMCDTLQALYEGRLISPSGKPYKNLIINIAPRHGKSFTAQNFTKWVLGKDNANRIITTSYNEKLSGRFAKAVRDDIDMTKVEPLTVVYNDIFPATHVKYGDASSSMWALEGQFFNYLATSPSATITGIGANIGIIDDIVKNKEEAYNDLILDGHYDWYNNTFLSRLEEGAIQILIMTRWSTKDLCGQIMKDSPEKWYLLEMKAYDEATDTMLCPELLSYESFTEKKAQMSVEIVNANYQQTPIDVQGRLYSSFKTYKDLPTFEEIIAYTDTADEGNDYLCSIIGGVYQGEIYVLDILYTQKPMEYTEPTLAKMLVEHKVNTCHIESNNGGRGFARNIESLLWSTHKTRLIRVQWFHQSKNKIARILSNATYVMDHIYFPQDWNTRWPDYHESMLTYQRAGKNRHDDAPDCTTGIAEKVIEGGRRITAGVRPF